MTTLLRQWQLLEMLMSIIGGGRPLVRLAVWNLDHIDSALAVAVAHLHCRGGAAGLIVFHSGVMPARRPLYWSQSELRGVPRTEWLETVPGRSSRRKPHRRVLESVILGPPAGRVDLIVAPTCPDSLPPQADVLDRLQENGYLVWPGPGEPPEEWRAALQPVDGSGSLFRKPPRRSVHRRSTPADGGPHTDGPPGDDEFDRRHPGQSAPTLADHQDRVALVDDYANLARALAHRFARRGERPEDLEQVAYMALVKAAARFDPTMGRPFGAFATPSIIGELKRHFRDKTWTVRVPRSVQEMHLAIRDAREELTHRHGRSPSINLIASYLGTTDEEVLGAMEAATNSWATSLDRPASEEQGSMTEIPVTDCGFDLSLDRSVLMDAIQELSPTEQLILKRVYFEERTQREVAAELGVSQMHISRVMTKTIAKMRRSFQVA